MSFREWLQNEVKTAGFKMIDRQQDGRLSSNHVVHVDGQGNLVQGYPETGKPYAEIQPSFSVLNLQNMHPQGKLFTDIVNGLRKLYGNHILDFTVHVYNASHPETGTGKYRTVGYWLKQPQGHYSVNNLPAFLYHGTSTNLWNDNIHQTGLLPRMLNKSGAGGSYGSQGDALSHYDKVYLSLHPDTAARSAAKQAARQYGGNPLILKIDTKGLMPNKFIDDEDSRADDSVKKMGTVAYAGRVPPSIIQPMAMWGVKTNSDGHKFDKWVPYEATEMTEHPLTTKLKENPAFFSPYDSPYYYALLDSNFIEEVEGKDANGFSTGKRVKIIKPITDEAIRQLIKSSPWVQTCNAILKDVNNYGMNGLKTIDRMPTRIFVTPEQKKIFALLLKTGMFRDSDGHLSMAYFKEKPAIQLAKALQAQRIDYRDFNKQISKIADNYNS